MKNKYLTVLVSIISDIFLLSFSFCISALVAGNGYLKLDFIYFFSIFIFVFSSVLLFYALKIYHILWRFSKTRTYYRIFLGLLTSEIILFVSQNAVSNKSNNLVFYFILFFLSAMFTVSCRLILKTIACNRISEMDEKCNRYNFLSGNIMVIGGGRAASMLIDEITEYHDLPDCKIRCIIDDNIAKKNTYISGIKIVGGRDMIIESVEKYKISTILFAIPSCSNEEKSEILKICQQTGCVLKTVPSLYQIMGNEKKSISSFDLSQSVRNVEIEDLLGREPIDLKIDSIMDYVSGKVVLVTGGGGTIGSELCRQIAGHNPGKLIIFDIYENNAYDIQNELLRDYPDLNLTVLIGSVRDSKRLDCVFSKYRPQIVYHAAAHKHVPLMEESPNETIKNNVIGTLKTAQCADKYSVEKFVLISTDKAVNPTNIMGASKRMCEMIIQAYNDRSKTNYVAVRFGNVLGSNGSVIPLFKKQIMTGGPVTVTDPNIIRYFMTIPEAVTLVLQAGATAKGGEIFVLDMGKPVKILDLAENMIKLAGLTPYKDIKIEFIGLRPGEKLYEEMLMAEEGLKKTENNLIHIGKPIDFDEDEFLKDLETLYKTMYDETLDIRAIIKKIVPTYHYNVSNS